MSNGPGLGGSLSPFRFDNESASNKTCDECGYDLRGSEPGKPCPECGRTPDPERLRVPVGAIWTMSVTAGLALLLLLTLDGVSSVLVQPFEEFTWAGTLPAFNLPGPKLWAVPLLQRPIGNTPELPGVVGTRTAMLSVLAIWLITTRKPVDEADAGGMIDRESVPASTNLLRLATRWTTIVVFGADFGLLVAQQGFWPSQLPPYRVLLVCAAELPATLLLYVYLDRLAGAFPGRTYRRAFDVLVWAVPMVIVAGAMMLVLSWLAPADKNLGEKRASLPIAAAYGTLALSVGVAASTAVTWLTGAFALRAFPSAWRALLGTRRWIRSLRSSPVLRDADRIRRISIAAGLVLLPIAMLMGIDQIGWYTSRSGLAANLPFYNFAGPKLWAAAAVPELASRGYWEPIHGRTLLTIINLAAFWLLTIAPGGGAESLIAKCLRLTVRWWPILAIGAALGFAATLRDTPDFEYSELGGRLRSEFFAAVTVLCEMPATFLLYVYLGVVAARHPRPKLRTSFWVMAVLIAALTIAGLSGLALSSHVKRSAFRDPPVLIAGAAYGAATLIVAAWSVVSILRLAAGVLLRTVEAGATRRLL